MLIELLTALQLFLETNTFTNNLALGLAGLSWLLTIVIFVPLHNKVAHRPIAGFLSKLVALNWLRTAVWTIATVNVFTKLVSTSS